MLGMAQFDLDCLMAKLTGREPTCYENGLEMIFFSITDPQDEALRQRFICSVNNEAVLKALFRVKADELSFSKAINIAIETEDAAKVAKETVYGAVSKKSSVSKIDFDKPVIS